MNVIETPRLALRRFTEEDIDALTALFADPEVMRFSLSGPRSYDESRRVLDHYLRLYAEYGWGLWAVWHKADDRLIGYCGLNWQEADGERVIEVAYRLLPTYWGGGIATEAARAVCEYALHQLGIPKLYAFIDPQNHGSIRVAEKIGMRYLRDSHLKHLPVRLYVLERQSSR